MALVGDRVLDYLEPQPNPNPNPDPNPNPNPTPNLNPNPNPNCTQALSPVMAGNVALGQPTSQSSWASGGDSGKALQPTPILLTVVIRKHVQALSVQ